MTSSKRVVDDVTSQQVREDGCGKATVNGGDHQHQLE